MTLETVVRGACLIGALACAGRISYSTFQTCHAERAHLVGVAAANQGKDPIGASDRILGGFRKLLQGQKTVGFVCSRALGADPASDRGFSVTQYALAPVKLVPDKSRPWVIARFDSQQELIRFVNESQLQIAANPMPGTALLHRGVALP